MLRYFLVTVNMLGQLFVSLVRTYLCVVPDGPATTDSSMKTSTSSSFPDQSSETSSSLGGDRFLRGHRSEGHSIPSRRLRVWVVRVTPILCARDKALLKLG